MDEYGRYAYLDLGISVGSRDVCKRKLASRAIHVRHPGTVIECPHASLADLHLEYTERHPLSVGTLDRIKQFAQAPGSVYVHCAAGQCRGPTIALVSLIARGMAPWDALACIVKATWRQYPEHVAPHFESSVLQQILTWSNVG